MRASAVQLNSNEDKERNLEIAERLVRRAASEGAELVVLPEKFNVIGSPEQLIAGAEPLDGPTLRWAGALAAELGLWLVAGSIVERVAGDDKLRNTSVLFAPDGDVAARVPQDPHVRRRGRRRHVPGVRRRDARRRDRAWPTAGELKLGLAVCYDLRFPELFRIMAVEGAQGFTLPSAFTVPTGRAHWEILIRARAIENQSFVIAAGQVGHHPPDHESYGHSMIVDPWGTVLGGRHGRAERVVVADIDLDAQAEVRAKLPSLANRQPGAYRERQAATR